MTSSSINKFKGLADQVNIVNTVYDLAIDFQGATTIARDNNSSNAQRIQLWLNSDTGDTVGKPKKGGIVKQLLGKILTSSNLSYYESQIRSKLQEDFNGELSILQIKLIPQPAIRAVTVNVILIDKVTGAATRTSATIR